MAYKYEPTKPNKYRKSKGYSTGWLNPGSWKAELGDSWFDGVEDLYNRGLVKDVADLKEKISTPEQRDSFLEEANKVSPKWYDKIANWFKKSPWALLSPIGIALQATDKDSPLRQGLSSVGGALSPDISLEEAQREFQKQQLGLASQNIPKELEYLQQRRDMPPLEQAFGQLGGTVAGGLGGTLLSQLAQSPSSRYGGGAQGNLSGALLSSLLGSLGAAGIPQGTQAAQQYGPPALDYLKQQGQRGYGYTKEKLPAILDYLNQYRRGI